MSKLYPVTLTRDAHCANVLVPRTSAFALVYPKYSFYVPNPCILGTRPVLPCKNGCCCKLELVEPRACLSYGTVAICLPWVAHRWNCHTSKFGSCCAYRSGEIRVLRISHCCICFPWATHTVRSQFAHSCLVTARAFMPASLIVIP